MGVREMCANLMQAFKGDFMKLNKEAVSVMYEAAANPSDHKNIVGIGQGVGRSIQ
jgi:hypothetical protein